MAWLPYSASAGDKLQFSGCTVELSTAFSILTRSAVRTQGSKERRSSRSFPKNSPFDVVFTALSGVSVQAISSLLSCGSVFHLFTAVFSSVELSPSAMFALAVQCSLALLVTSVAPIVFLLPLLRMNVSARCVLCFHALS